MRQGLQGSILTLAAHPAANFNAAFMLRCPSCGELVTGERDICVNCGRAVPDPALPAERRMRAALIAAFVLGALVLLGNLVRQTFLGRG
jgi:hypothetical protein